MCIMREAKLLEVHRKQMQNILGEPKLSVNIINHLNSSKQKLHINPKRWSSNCSDKDNSHPGSYMRSRDTAFGTDSQGNVGRQQHTNKWYLFSKLINSLNCLLSISMFQEFLVLGLYQDMRQAKSLLSCGLYTHSSEQAKQRNKQENRR